MASNLEGPRRINGQLVRPTPPCDDSPSTACQPSIVCAPGGVSLSRGPPGFGPSPGRVPSRRIAPPPPPLPPAPVHHGNATFNAVTYPREWTPLHTQPKASGGAARWSRRRHRVKCRTSPIQPAVHTEEEEEHQDLMDQEERSPQQEDVEAPPQQSGGASGL